MASGLQLVEKNLHNQSSLCRGKKMRVLTMVAKKLPPASVRRKDSSHTENKK